jgi:hypothetical protein
MVVAVQRLEARQTLQALLRQAISCPTLEAIRIVLAGGLEQAMQVVHAWQEAHWRWGRGRGKLTCYLALVHSSLCSKHIRPLMRHKHCSGRGGTATLVLTEMQVRCNHDAGGHATLRSQ